ncbi:hypothetical protein CERSUDRAFT_96004 [Gelatoporia subvermispora B]|uniref:DUF159-domain-containing protein n=1 Tax=Ceriporiopsis subvermispora (strain B) TaxID=914234 RepID=M2PI41_CERS8|nr:hypothetical protein CERSUDRAFT_96004 [Gelatoporia subvermispora B]
MSIDQPRVRAKKGRYSLSLSLSGDKLMELNWSDFGDPVNWNDIAGFRSSHNIGCGSFAPVLFRRARDGPAVNCQTMSWGVELNDRALRDPDKASSQQTTPARTRRFPPPWFRSERLKERGGFLRFKFPSRCGTCVIVCEGYYVSRRGRMYFVQRQDHGLLFLAGVFYGLKESERSFAIITHAAIQPYKKLSNRPPVLLRNPAAIQAWLNSNIFAPNEGLEQLVRPSDYSDCPLKYHEVSLRINDPNANGQDLILPISPGTTVTLIPSPPLATPPADAPPKRGRKRKATVETSEAAGAPPKTARKRKAAAKQSEAILPSQPDETQTSSSQFAEEPSSSTAATSTVPAKRGRKRMSSPSASAAGRSKRGKGPVGPASATSKRRGKKFIATSTLPTSDPQPDDVMLQ